MTLDSNIAFCDYYPVTLPDNPSHSDPTLAIAERQLVMLVELAELGMAASRAFASSAIASAKAEEMVLADEHFVPEVGRARACGARDAAESFQKVSRAVRLTLKLEMMVAEIVRDIHAGIVTRINGVADSKEVAPADGPRSFGGSGNHLTGPSSPMDTPDRERLDRESERLAEFDRPDRFARAPVAETAESIRADLAAESTRRLARRAAAASRPSAWQKGPRPGQARSGRPPPD